MRELGWNDDPKDFLEYAELLSGGAMAGSSQELQRWASRATVDRKGGALVGRISKHLTYGDQQMPETQIKIGRVRESLNDFVRNHKEGIGLANKNYQRLKIKLCTL